MHWWLSNPINDAITRQDLSALDAAYEDLNTRVRSTQSQIEERAHRVESDDGELAQLRRELRDLCARRARVRVERRIRLEESAVQAARACCQKIEQAMTRPTMSAEDARAVLVDVRRILLRANPRHCQVER